MIQIRFWIRKTHHEKSILFIFLTRISNFIDRITVARANSFRWDFEYPYLFLKTYVSDISYTPKTIIN